MALAVNTVAAGGLPVVDVTATFPKMGSPVSEALPGKGVAVTKVTNLGLPVTYLAGSAATFSAFEKLILNPAGADASTTFTDASPAAHGNADKNGSPEVDTAITFGGMPTLYMPGNAAIGWPDNADFDLGRPSGAKWCIEAAVRFLSLTGTQFIIAKWGAAGNSSVALSKTGGTNALTLTYTQDGTTNFTLSYAWSPSIGVWYEVAANYDGDKIRVFLDGAVVATSSSLGAIALFDSTQRLSVGCGGDLASFLFNGSIGRIRATNGSDRAYGSSGYTVPAPGYY